MRRIGPFLVLFCCIAFATITEDALAQYHSLDQEAKDAGKVTCTLSPEGNATIRLRRDNYHKAEKVRLFLSPFSSANKRAAVVGFADSDGANQAPVLEKQEEFKADEQFPHVDIKARAWDPDASYNGTLTLVAEEGNASAVGVTLIGHNPFTLFATDAQYLPEITRTLPRDGRLTVELGREPAQKPEKVRLRLSAFCSDGNPNALVGFPSPEGRGKDPVLEQEKTIPAGETLLPIEIEARSWAAGVKYSGILTLVPEVGNPSHYRVSLQGPDPKWCTLVAEPKTASINHTLFWGPISRRGETGRFVVTLRDQTGKIPVDGLLVRLEGQPNSLLGTSDNKANIEFRLKNQEVPSLTTRLPLDAPEADRRRRSILPGDQSDLEVVVKDLPAGEHQFKIRVSAANSEPDKSPEITLTVKVKHGWPLAVAVLILAGTVSFLTTKAVDNQRKRIELDHRIRALRKDWLTSLPALEPIAWLFAAQRQSSDLLKQAHLKLIPAFQEISNQLDKAERLLELARTYHELRVALPTSRLDRLERYRFLKELDGIFRSIDPELLEEKTTKEIKQRLEATRSMLANPVSSDRQAVCAKAAWLQGEVVPEKLAAGDDLGKLNRLVEEVFKKPGDSPSEVDIKAMDRLGAALQILWFWRNDAEQLRQLRPLVIKDKADSIKLDKLLDESDKMTWGKVQKEAENGRIRIALSGQAMPPKPAPSPAPGTPSQAEAQTMPAYCLEPVRALEPLAFLLWFDDAHVATSFPVNARIKCHWTFVLKGNGTTQSWSAHSDGRRIVQSVPTTGTLEIDVIMSFMGDEVRLPVAQVEIGKTEQLNWMKAFALSEFVATAAATLVALLSGLNVEPFNKLTFGSLNDYLQLFLWGAAVDQGKNLFKTVQASSGSERGTAQK